VQFRPSPQRIKMDYSEWKFQQLQGNIQPSYDTLSTASKFAFLSIAIFFWSAILFVENWLLMIFIGTLHSVFNFIPALGFWTVFWFNILAGIVINIIRKSKNV
jgi:hypothetical protein